MQYTPRGNSNILDIVIHQNVRLSDVTVSDVLHSDHLQIFFHKPDHVSVGKFRPELKPTEIGSGFEAWPLIYFNLDSKTTLLKKLRKQLVLSQPLSPWHIGCQHTNSLSDLNNAPSDFLQLKPRLRNQGSSMQNGN
jgi:hypothetical protein